MSDSQERRHKKTPTGQLAQVIIIWCTLIHVWRFICDLEGLIEFLLRLLVPINNSVLFRNTSLKSNLTSVACLSLYSQSSQYVKGEI